MQKTIRIPGKKPQKAFMFPSCTILSTFIGILLLTATTRADQLEEEPVNANEMIPRIDKLEEYVKSMKALVDMLAADVPEEFEKQYYPEKVLQELMRDTQSLKAQVEKLENQNLTNRVKKLEDNQALLLKTGTCPDGWYRHGNSCYRYYSNSLTWSDAQRMCSSMGSHLAIVPDYIEATILYRLMPDRKYTWVGGSDPTKKRVWEWIDGSKFNKVPWGTRQPDNVKNIEYCVSILLDDLLHDLNCSREKPFICQM